MDLTKQPPRRPSNLGIGDIVGLARMTDKARGHNAELLGDYKYGSNSGLDRDVLEFIRMDEEEFAEQADQLNDSMLSELIIERFGRSNEELGEFNRFRLEQTPQDALHERLLVERVTKYAPGRTDITTVFQSIELDDWGAFREKDLTAGPPRTAYLRSVANIVGAARMADKARAFKNGRLGEYKYGEDSPLDHGILQFIGISAKDFAEGAYENPNDSELSSWITKRSSNSSGCISMLNAKLCDRGIRTDGFKERFIQRRKDICADRLDIETFFDLMDVDDQLTFGVVDLTRRPPRSPYDTSIGGVMALSRMIDKARACITGNLGEYGFGEDSGFDRLVLEFLGLTQEEVLDAIRVNSTDKDVVTWLGDRLEKAEDEIGAHNERLYEYGPVNERQERFMRKAIANLDRRRSDINTFAALVLLDDSVSFARQRAAV